MIALHVTDDLQSAENLQELWERWGAGVPLVIIESPYRSFTQPLMSYIQDALRLKAALLFRKDTVAIDVPQHLDEPPEPISPAEKAGVT